MTTVIFIFNKFKWPFVKVFTDSRTQKNKLHCLLMQVFTTGHLKHTYYVTRFNRMSFKSKVKAVHSQYFALVKCDFIRSLQKLIIAKLWSILCFVLFSTLANMGNFGKHCTCLASHRRVHHAAVSMTLTCSSKTCVLMLMSEALGRL